MQQLYLIKHDVQEKGSIIHFPLPGLLSDGHILALNMGTRSLSLLSDGPQLVTGQQFSMNEMRIILPILESFPHYSPYEVLLSYLESDIVTADSIARCRKRLREAQELRTWQQELRPLRRALSSLRQKLHVFNLEISNIRERGCSLTSLISKEVQ
jgi:hypothetical protein